MTKSYLAVVMFVIILTMKSNSYAWTNYIGIGYAKLVGMHYLILQCSPSRLKGKIIAYELLCIG